MKTSTPTLLLGFTSVALLASTLRAAPFPADGASYQLTDLGALPTHKESVAAAINNSGQVAGTSRADAFTETAFRYEPETGTLREVGAFPLGASTRAFGLNDAGVIVGDSSFAANPTKGDYSSARRHFSVGPEPPPSEPR